jgi:hypothetical protein
MNNWSNARCLLPGCPRRSAVMMTILTAVMVVAGALNIKAPAQSIGPTDFSVTAGPSTESSSPPISYVEKASFSQGTSQLLKPLPDGLTSFGAITLDEYLYVFSGHHGAAHTFGKHVLSNHFRRIRYADPSSDWQDLEMHHPAQSVALVSDGQFVYRIAGLSFRNSASEETDFDSTVHFARFDPHLNRWEDLADLPEGRSSMDAAIIGRSIFVVGGWNLQGNSPGTARWHDTMMRFCLDTPEAGWQTLPGPGYDIRALSVAALGDALYVMGGMTPRGISRKVSRFDISTQQWTEGPGLPSDHRTAGFATGAFASQGRLYNAGSSGNLYRLSQSGDNWEIADRLLFPRNFLRVIPGGPHHLLAVGGTSGNGRSAAIELIDVSLPQNGLNATTSPRPKIALWKVVTPSPIVHPPSLWTNGNKLITVGGGDQNQDFVFEFDLSLQTVRQLASLPSPVQHATLLSNSQTSEHQSLVLIGGLNPVSKFANQGSGEQFFEPRKEIFQYDFAADCWTTLPVELPIKLGMHSAVRYQDALWLFGGICSRSLRSTDDILENPTILHWWGDESEPAAIPGLTLPTLRRMAGCVLVGDELFLIGGLDDKNQIIKQVDVLNLQTRKWRQIESPLISRASCSTACLGNSIFLFGGQTENSGNFSTVDSLEIYDTRLNHWQVMEPRLPGIDGAMQMLSYDNRLLFFGTDANNPNVVTFAIYDPNLATNEQTQYPVADLRPPTGVLRTEEDPIRNAQMMMRRDTDKDGRLSQQELGSRMQDFFQRADRDRDGYLTFEEIVQAHEIDKKSEENN